LEKEKPQKGRAQDEEKFIVKRQAFCGGEERDLLQISLRGGKQREVGEN